MTRYDYKKATEILAKIEEKRKKLKIITRMSTTINNANEIYLLYQYSDNVFDKSPIHIDLVEPLIKKMNELYIAEIKLLEKDFENICKIKHYSDPDME
jgi:hypothetical protein